MTKKYYSYIVYLDANNLYKHAMWQYLLTSSLLKKSKNKSIKQIY